MNFFYPGSSLWKKRIVMMASLFTAGPTLFIQDVQNTMSEVGKDMIAIADDLSRPAEEAALVVENKVLPVLDYLQSTPLGSRIVDHFGLYQTGDIREGLQQVHTFRLLLKELAPCFRLSATILRWTGMLFWASLAMSIAWLGVDYLKCNNRKAKRFIVFGLLVSIPFNILIYRHLNSTLAELIDMDLLAQALN